MKRLLIFVCLMVGCQDVITVENLPASVTSVGPIDVLDPAAGTVSVQFTVRDPEGDDVPVLFEICDDDGDACGVAVIDAQQSDKLGRTTTVPENTDVVHVVVWDTACGRFEGAERTATNATAQYAAKFSIRDAEEPNPILSDVFAIDAITDLDEIPCER